MPEIGFERRGSIAVVTLQRPEKLNAVNQRMAERLIALAEEIGLDDTVKTVILAGAGDRAFCSGSDLGELTDREPAHRLRVRSLRPFPYATFGWRTLQPTIAMIHGFCLGGGLELAINCDMRVASDDAEFGAPEITHGWFGGGSTSQLLPRLIGPGRAMEVLTTGSRFSAKEAWEWGLLNRLVKRDRLEIETFALAERIASQSPLVAQTVKRAIRYSMNVPLDSGNAAELDLSWITFVSPERTEGIKAFRKRSRKS